MKDKKQTKQEADAGVLRAVVLSKYSLLVVVASLAIAAVLAYFYREDVSSLYTEARESVISTVGLGLAPTAMWVAVFLGTLVFKRSWLRRANLWFGSLFLVASAVGFMAFFEPFDGPLAPFTLHGDVSLGGDVGAAIAGSTGWTGALRVTGLLLVGAAVALPKLARALAPLLGGLLVFAYVYTVVVLKWSLSRLRGMYTVEPARLKPRVSDEPAVPPADPYVGVAEEIVTETPAAAPEPASLAEPPPSPMSQPEIRPSHAAAAVPRSEVQVVPLGAESALPVLVDTARSTDVASWHAPHLDPVAGPEVEAGGDTPTGGAKFNRFWSGQPQGSDDGDELDDGLDDEEKEPEARVIDSSVTSWDRPPIDILVDTAEGGISEGQMKDTGEIIKRTLGEYGVEVEIGQIRPGPTVSMYGLTPGWVRRYKQVKVTDEDGLPKRDESGKPIITRVETKTRVKVDSIMSREKDLSLALKTPSIRIETPAMGESLVGIEVPNPSSSLVTLRGVMESHEFKGLRSKAKLPIALGKGSGGETVVIDLASMPHLLIAGATGSGKSVCINTIVSCLIMEKSPAEMRLLLVDPKRVELTPYNGIPHLLEPVVVETDQVVSLLKGLIREMLGRYRRMEEVGVRNIDAYNARMPDKMPYLVVAVDELADLMMSASFDVEQSLCRLAQLGRATGIHLIVATQRPSVDVVTGLIKANFPSRISFGVTSQIDSRTILDTAGAEKLLGKGDMLYLAVDGARPERVQGVFISDTEIESLMRFWKTTPWPPLSRVSLHTVGDDPEEDEDAVDGNSDDRDELMDSAVDVAQRYKKLSTSLLQRRLRIGYPRAARLMDQLEEAGIVGPGDGSKSRDVIMSGT